MLTILIVYLAIFLLTALGVGLFRRWSLRRRIIDLPNERSSHSRPTPRGGGIVICLVSLAAYLVYRAWLPEAVPWGYFAGALLIAAVSWIDDLRTVSPVWRFLCHSLAAAVAIYSLGAVEIFPDALTGQFWQGLPGTILTFFWIVWLINAYNFMDGIDGIAGTQALTAGIGWSITGFLLEIPEIGFYGGVLASSGLGFLLYNWQPAKIFMGDVGSAFLGYTFAVMPLFAVGRSEETDGRLALIALLLVWLFVFDSVLTLFRRLARGEKVWRPHREHIYQQMVIAGLSHSTVTLAYGILSSLIAVPLVFAVLYGGAYNVALAVTVAAVSALLVLLWRNIKIFKR